MFWLTLEISLILYLLFMASILNDSFKNQIPIKNQNLISQTFENIKWDTDYVLKVSWSIEEFLENKKDYSEWEFIIFKKISDDDDDDDDLDDLNWKSIKDLWIKSLNTIFWKNTCYYYYKNNNNNIKTNF